MSAPRTFTMGGGWGDAINWRRIEDDGLVGHVIGWKTPKPAVGDILRVPMASGRVAHFGFAVIEPTLDPPDMFFGTVVMLGYEEEVARP